MMLGGTRLKSDKEGLLAKPRGNRQSVQKCSLAALCSHSGAFPIQGPVVIGISRKLVGVEESYLRPLVPNET